MLLARPRPRALSERAHKDGTHSKSIPSALYRLKAHNVAGYFNGFALALGASRKSCTLRAERGASREGRRRTEWEETEKEKKWDLELETVTVTEKERGEGDENENEISLEVLVERRK
ncbi:unnamed protein product [Peniophora sp. CBMAI 1063]|nr:unnamed protein product [Peniophora sp. CBMAI 1063]